MPQSICSYAATRCNLFQYLVRSETEFINQKRRGRREEGYRGEGEKGEKILSLRDLHCSPTPSITIPSLSNT